MSSNPVKAILIDVGGPLVDDSALDEYWDQWMADYLTDYLKREVTLQEVLDVQEEAIRCYSPSTFSYVIWHFVKPDMEHFRMMRDRFDNLEYSRFFSIRPEAAEICNQLSKKYALATAANQPSVTRGILTDAGILGCFKFKEMSGDMQLSKPDLRFFMRILDSVGVPAEQAVMVGDRQDNDIVPAKLLGMRAIKWQGGMFEHQMVRLPNEEPDACIKSLTELPDIIAGLDSV